MRVKAQLALVISTALVLCVIIGFVMFTLDRSHFANRTIEFQETQRAAVTQIAERIRWQFEKLDDALYNLSQIPHVQFLEENEALLHLIRAYRTNEDLVDGIFRVEKTGVLQVSYPNNADSPYPADLQRILEHARSTGETVHNIVQRHGNAAPVLVIAKPVYTIQGEVHLHPNNKFAGLLLFTVSLDRLNRNILDLPSFGRGGFFFVMTDQGVIVGAERGPLLGTAASALTKDYPEVARDGFLKLLARMRKGATGNSTYWHPLGPHLPDLVINEYSHSLKSPPNASNTRRSYQLQKRMVAFTSIMLGNGRWSVAVFSPEQDVTALIQKSIGDRWLIATAFIVTLGVMTGLIIVIIRRNHFARLDDVSRAAQELQQSQAKLANAQRIAKVGHWEYCLRSGALVISDSMYKILELPRREEKIAYRDFFRMLHGCEKKAIRRSIFGAIKTRTGCSFEHLIVGRDGTKRFIRQEIEIQFEGGGGIAQLTGIAQDVTERRMAEEKIRELAYFDCVTGLPNRTFLKELINRWIQSARRFQRTLAVLFLDLDNFKCINDTLGHDAGDILLREVSTRLVTCVRSSDFTSRPIFEQAECVSVTRLGGDEFVIVLPEIQFPENAAQVAQRVADALAMPIAVDGNEITVSASVGIAVFPADGEDAETLLKNADAAMYHAKSEGRNGYAFYTRPLHDRALKRLSLEAGLRKAIKREEFLLYLQPKLDLRRQWAFGAEALLRWLHPQDGLIAPGEFIALAEDTGLIRPIGEWVLREACRQAAKWQVTDWPQVRVSVNLSAVQFKHRGFVQCVEGVLGETGLPPECLELELTESLLMANTEASIVTLNDLAAIGVSVSIDDFGTGYSSLSYLKRFPLTALKIDRSFVRDIPDDTDDATIVNATIALAHSLRLRATAEGVEKQAQLDFLMAAGCDEVQGYLIGRPMPEAEFNDWMYAQRSKNTPIASSQTIPITSQNNVVTLGHECFGRANKVARINRGRTVY